MALPRTAVSVATNTLVSEVLGLMIYISLNLYIIKPMSIGITCYGIKKSQSHLFTSCPLVTLVGV